MNWIKILQSATRLPKVNSAITTTTGSSPNYYLVNKQQSGVLGVGKILFSKRAGLDKGDIARAESLVWERKLHLRSCGHVPDSGPNVSRDDLAKMWAEDSKSKAKREKDYSCRIKVEKTSEQETASVNGDSYDSRQFVREPLWSSSPEEAWIKPLLSRSNLLIARDIEWANLTLGFKQENRYAIVDVNNPQVPAGFIREQSNVIARQLLRTRRPFVATITDGSDNELFRVRRPFWRLTSSIYTEVGGKLLLMKRFCACMEDCPLTLIIWIKYETYGGPTDVPDSGLLCDLLWSDPAVDVKGWGMNDRGVSYTFGADIVSQFLEKHDLDLICRAHQVVEDGYEFFADRQLVTVFSAPNYCGEFDNAGAMMSVDDSLMCSFQILKPAEKKSKFNSGISLFGSTTTAKPGNTPSGFKQFLGGRT